MENRYNGMQHIKPIVNEYLFNLWYDENCDELQIKFAETGADKELDFDEEQEILKEWELFKDKLGIS